MKTTQSPEQLETAHLEKLRSQLSSDIELLQQKEANLRDHEQRLRVLIASCTEPVRQPADAGPVGNNYGYGSRHAAAELDAAWEKYNRSHALLEAARRCLVDDRLAMRAREERLQLREEVVTRREALIKAREAELDAQAAASVATAAESALKAKTKTSFTAAPFLLAKNLLAPRRA